MTHTYAVLKVSKETYEEIKQRLIAADYQHAILGGDRIETIDMHGIGLQVEESKPYQFKEKPPAKSSTSVASFTSPTDKGRSV